VDSTRPALRCQQGREFRREVSPEAKALIARQHLETEQLRDRYFQEMQSLRQKHHQERQGLPQRLAHECLAD
jgi:aspartate/tyrosine/aromatic aminotransferase